MSNTEAIHIALLPKQDRHDWFCENARYQPTAPLKSRYTLRFGYGLRLYSDDTMDLFEKMEREVKKIRRKHRNPAEAEGGAEQ